MGLEIAEFLLGEQVRRPSCRAVDQDPSAADGRQAGRIVGSSRASPATSQLPVGFRQASSSCSPIRPTQPGSSAAAGTRQHEDRQAEKHPEANGFVKRIAQGSAPCTRGNSDALTLGPSPTHDTTFIWAGSQLISRPSRRLSLQSSAGAAARKPNVAFS